MSGRLVFCSLVNVFRRGAGFISAVACSIRGGDRVWGKRVIQRGQDVWFLVMSVGRVEDVHVWHGDGA